MISSAPLVSPQITGMSINPLLRQLEPLLKRPVENVSHDLVAELALAISQILKPCDVSSLHGQQGAQHRRHSDYFVHIQTDVGRQRAKAKSSKIDRRVRNSLTLRLRYGPRPDGCLPVDVEPNEPEAGFLAKFFSAVAGSPTMMEQLQVFGR